MASICSHPVRVPEIGPPLGQINVLGKVLLLIVSIGAAACVLLTLRQQRLDVVHDMAVIHKRMAQHDKALFEVRSRIAQSLSPVRIEQLASAMSPLKPIGVDAINLPGIPDSKVYFAGQSPAKTESATKPTKGGKKPAEPAVATAGGKRPAER